MRTIPVEQALFTRRDHAAPQLQARSAGFADAWLPEAERLAVGFGERPVGVACPLAMFAQPLGVRHVAVVRVTDREDAGGRLLAFHFLVLPRAAYLKSIGDPFLVADRLGPTWESAEALPTLTWAAEAPPATTLAQVQGVLKRVKSAALREDEDPEHPDFERTAENSESPALLGGVQILVDGGKLVFERPRGDATLAAALWTLLPYSTRSQLWPASFAFGNELGFDVVVVPRLNVGDFEGYTTEDQAAEYPQGSYELALQTAAESGDAAALQAVFRKRNSNEVLRLAIVLLVGMMGVVLLGQLLGTGESEAPGRTERAAAAAGIVAVSDPLTAGMMLECGIKTWGGQIGAAKK